MLRKARKVLLLFTVLTLMVSSFAACSGKEGQKPSEQAVKETTKAAVKGSEKPVEKKTVIWMNWGSPEGLNAKIQVLYDTYPEIKEKYNIEPVIGGKTDMDVAQKFRLSLVANTEIPDMLQLNYTQLPEFAERGVILDVTKHIQPYKDNLLPGAVELASYKGKMLTFPNQIKTKMWFYRKDMFEAAGIDVEKVKDEDDFIAAGKKLQAKFPKSYIWNIGPQIAHYNISMVVSGNGTKFVDEKGEYIISKDPGVRKAFEAFKKIKDSGVAVSINDFTPDWEKAFADATLASSLISNWFRSTSYLPTWAPDQKDKWAVTDWPTIGGAVGGSAQGGSITVIPEKAKEKDAAAEILTKLHLTKKGSLELYKKFPVVPPYLKDAVADPKYNEPDAYFGPSLPKMEIKAMQSFRIFPFTPAADKEFQIVNTYLAKYLMTNTPLDTVLKEAEADLKNQIGNPFNYISK